MGYNEVVHASLSAGIVGGSDECAANTAAAFAAVDKMVATQAGVTAVTEKFNTCKPVTTANDTLTFVSNLSNNFQVGVGLTTADEPCATLLALVQAPHHVLVLAPSVCREPRRPSSTTPRSQARPRSRTCAVT